MRKDQAATAELRLLLLGAIRDDLDLDAELQGKRIVVRHDGRTYLVLVTRAMHEPRPE